MKKTGTTEHDVLRALSDRARFPRTSADIATRIGKSKSAAAAALKKLREKGLVYVLPIGVGLTADSQEERRRRVAFGFRWGLTDAGKEHIKQMGEAGGEQ